MKDYSVEVTGIGIASPIGCSRDQFWSGCKQAKSGITRLAWAEEFGCRSKVCARVPERELRRALRSMPAQVASLGRHVQLGLAASWEAINDARGEPELLVVGSATGGFQEAEEAFAGIRQRCEAKVLNFDELGETVAEYLGLQVAQRTGSNGCTSSTDAIGYAAWMIREGHFRSALALGVEASLTPSTLAAFETLGAVGNDARPFSKSRKGFVLGEAGGALYLERSDRARERGTESYARFAGFGSVNNSFHMTSIETDGRAIARSIEEALTDTGEPEKVREWIGYINAHGSGTRQNDLAEAAAYHKVFGRRANLIPVNSTKALVGHSLGAAGIVETIHLLLSLRHSTVTPAVNFEVKDPAIDLFLPAAMLEPYPIPYALKTASGFGGIHSALIFQSGKE
jgi:3-oxoacyl-(acyl-carrier-protein) synthase